MDGCAQNLEESGKDGGQVLKGVCQGEWSQAYWWIQSSGGLEGAHFVLTYLHQNPQSLHVLCCLQVSACLLRGHKNSLQEGFYGDPYFLEFLLLIKEERLQEGFFLRLLNLRCLHLKRILVPKCHILG